MNANYTVEDSLAKTVRPELNFSLQKSATANLIFVLFRPIRRTRYVIVP
jgi:hypothetical protein